MLRKVCFKNSGKTTKTEHKKTANKVRLSIMRNERPYNKNRTQEAQLLTWNIRAAKCVGVCLYVTILCDIIYPELVIDI